MWSRPGGLCRLLTLAVTTTPPHSCTLDSFHTVGTLYPTPTTPGRETDRQRQRQTGRQRPRQRERQRQTDRQTQTQTDRDTQTDRQDKGEILSSRVSTERVTSYFRGKYRQRITSDSGGK